VLWKKRVRRRRREKFSGVKLGVGGSLTNRQHSPECENTVSAQHDEVGWSSDPIRSSQLNSQNVNGGLKCQQSLEGNSKYRVGTCENFFHGDRNLACGVGVYEGLGGRVRVTAMTGSR
jgi:hypothetical protein